MKTTILEGKHMKKHFKEANMPTLDAIDIQLYQEDFTVIMGSSGAGKSTLLYSLSGMNQIDEGEVLFQNENITTFTEKQHAHLRSQTFGFVFQQTNLVSNLTLFENVAVAGYLHPHRTTKQTDERVRQLLKQMHVENAMNRLPSNVSGGEAQRAAIARAMINDPVLLFADEPTGALNRKNSDEVLSILQNLHEQGQSILMVTHDLRAAAHGTRILYMDDGKIISEIDVSFMKEKSVKEREAYINQWLTSLAW